MTTGEFPIINPNSMGGASVRAIEVECTDKIYSDLVGLCAIINENYGWAGREFIEWLKDPENVQMVNEYRMDMYHDLLKAQGEDKQAASLSAILTADAIASTIFFHDGNELTVEDVVSIMTKKKDIDANLRALNFVLELVAVNRNHFVPDDWGNYRGDVWGKMDVPNIYIIKSVFDREMAAAGYNSTSFLSWAKRNGLLITDNNRRTKNAGINGNVVMTVCLNRDACKAKANPDD